MFSIYVLYNSDRKRRSLYSPFSIHTNIGHTRDKRLAIEMQNSIRKTASCRRRFFVTRMSERLAIDTQNFILTCDSFVDYLVVVEDFHAVVCSFSLVSVLSEREVCRP